MQKAIKIIQCARAVTFAVLGKSQKHKISLHVNIVNNICIMTDQL